MPNKSEPTWNDVKKSTQSLANNILSTTRETYEASRDKFNEKWTDAVEDLEKDARRLVRTTESQIRKNPISFVVGALAAGLVLGLILRRR